MDEIFDDYLEHNPTRNRALDLLPLLAQIDMDRVQATVADAKVKARPTFHYRLPNCHIGQTNWTLANAWNTWCVVERLANQPDDLDALAEAYLAAEHAIWGVNRSDWINTVDQWLNDHALV